MNSQSQNFNIYNINEVIIQTQKLIFHNWINKLFSEEDKVPEHCLKLERWRGPQHVNEVKQYEIVSSLDVNNTVERRWSIKNVVVIH